ncbi:MAG: hypothetical protein Q9225_002699 [Loekoesia sp. 1 TL-2023]
MSKRLRGFLIRRLSLTQLQTFWQRTLTSGQSLKQALSSRLSPQSANFPITRPGDDRSQETFLPVFDSQPSSDSSLACGKTGQAPSPQAHKATPTAPAANPPLHTTNMMHDKSINLSQDNPRMNASPYLSAHSSVQTENAISLYANASTQTATQTELATPETAQTSDVADTQSDVDSCPSPYEDQKMLFVEDDQEAESDVGLSIQMPNETSDDHHAPEIYDGQSQILVTNYDGRDCLTMLLTKDMINDLDEITEEGDKLRRLEARFERADLKVKDALAEISYCKSLLETAESQEEVDELHGDIARHQKTLPRDEKRRDILKNELEVVRRNVVYLEEISRDAIREVLTRAELLKTPNEQADEGSDEEDDEASQSAGSPIELIPYEVDQVDNAREGSVSSGDSNVSLEKLHRRAASEELRDRYAELCEAEREFEGRYQDYEEEKANFQQMLREGTCQKSMTWFDHLNIKSTQELTRKLVAAEDAYENAFARRKKIGPNQHDQESGFLTDTTDGYLMSVENEGDIEVPKDWVYEWLKGIPEVENPPDIAELKNGAGLEFGQLSHGDVEVSSIRSARMSDAWSCRDWTRNRRRIDRWREIAGREK